MSEKSILIVEDEKEILEELAFSYKRVGFKVHKTFNDKQAIEILKNNIPDVVLTDVRIPEISGEKLIQLIYEKNYDSVVLCITGYSDLSLEKTYKAGVDAFFHKPVSIKDILSATEHFLKKRTKARNAVMENERLQAKLLKQQQLYNLGIISSSLAHEIKNQIGSTQMCSSYLLELAKKNQFSQDKYVKFLKQMDVTGGQMSAMVNGILSLSSPPTKANFTQVPFYRIMDKLEIILDYKLNWRKIRLQIEGDKNLSVNCMPALLTQVMLNLVINAIQATETRQGEKWINIEWGEQTDINSKEMEFWKKIYQTLPDNFLYVTISDSGLTASLDPGKIGNLFYSTKTEEKLGTGLGLYLSSKIIHRHGGHIFLDTQKKNTTFVVILPNPCKI